MPILTLSTKPTCPRCGGTYSYIRRARRGDRTYLYAVHYIKQNGKRRASYCYLGPSGNYVHAEKLLLLNLQGLVGLELIDVVNTALAHLEIQMTHGRAKIPLETLERIQGRVQDLMKLAEAEG
jgi:hypothetical protein